LSRSSNEQENSKDFRGGKMNTQSLRMLIVNVVLELTLLGGLSVSAAEHAQITYYARINIDDQVVELRKNDGTISSGEFLSEIILLPDGRANGGFGIWELGAPDVLSLYHVVKGQRIVDRRTGPFYSFRAERLAPLPGTEITITLRPVQSQLPTPNGTVTFTITLEFVDNDSIGHDGAPLSFNANGQVSQGCVGPAPCDSALPEFGIVRALPQTLLVQTLTGNYTATFENVALVFSRGSAVGSLALSLPGGAVQNVHIVGGNIQFRNGEATGAWLRGRTPSTGADQLPVLMVIANQESASEPCRIYDIVGTQVGPTRAEVQGRITGLVVDPL
jgi:hypothetical protein